MSPVHVFQPRDKSSQARSSAHQSPSPDSTLDLLQRALQTHEDGKLKPDAVIALQSAYGNHFVRSLLERKHPEEQPETQATGTSDVQANQLGPTLSQHVSNGRQSGNMLLQREVYKRMGVRGPLGLLTEDQIVDSFRVDQRVLFETAEQIGMRREDLIAICRPYVASSDPYTLGEVSRFLEQIIQERQAQATGTNASLPVAEGNVEFHVQTATESVPPGMVKNFSPSTGHYEICSQRIDFNASVLASGLTSEIAQWEVGFLQTVTSLDRKVYYKDQGGNDVEWKTWLPGPRRDGPLGYAGPWYDASSYSMFVPDSRGINPGLQNIAVRMDDHPGIEWDLDPRSQVDRLEGSDTFKTWLVARKKDGSVIKYIRGWNWHITYNADQGAVLDNVDPNPTGAEAVFGGQVPDDPGCKQQSVRKIP